MQHLPAGGDLLRNAPNASFNIAHKVRARARLYEMI
jgi:hypothetical protein